MLRAQGLPVGGSHVVCSVTCADLGRQRRCADHARLLLELVIYDTLPLSEGLNIIK